MSLDPVATFVAGAVLTLITGRYSQKYSRELDSAARLTASYHRAQEMLDRYRELGLAPEPSIDSATKARDAYTDAIIEYRVQKTVLELLVGWQDLDAAEREIEDCFQRIEGLVIPFSNPANLEQLRGFEDSDTNRKEVRLRIKRVERQTEILRAKYSRNAMVLPFLGRRRTKRAESALAELGAPERHGYVVAEPPPMDI